MLAVLFLLFSTVVGRALLERTLRRWLDDALATDLRGNFLNLPRWLVVWPASFVIGTMLATWCVYLVGYAAQNQIQPLKLANTFVLIGLSIIFVAVVWRRSASPNKRGTTHVRDFLNRYRLEIILGSIALCASAGLMWRTLYIAHGNQLVVGISVFSDFGPHLAVIRSFSHGQNFPTEYPHFPDGHARYHFLFQFFAGNLEYLGLPLDWAFNLPSALALAGSLILLYSLATAVSGFRSAGILTVLFFFFRSSFAWEDFVHGTGFGSAMLKVLKNDEFIGRTEHEDWGLWNQNIFVNQRHLAFALCILWLTLLLVLPRLKQMVAALRAPERGQGITSWLRVFLVAPQSWFPQNWNSLGGAVMIGVVLGAAGFWNGAVVITALLLLAGLTCFSRHRLEFAAIAGVTLVLAFLQNRLFLGPNSLAVKPEFSLGFLARRPATATTIFHYYSDLLGVLPWVIGTALIVLRLRGKDGYSWLAVVFCLPAVMATTIQFTPELAINHKYVLMSVALLNILAAAGLVEVWTGYWSVMKPIVAILVFLLVATGIVDLISLINRDRRERAMVVQLDDPLLKWIEAHAAPREVFLTDWYSLHPLLLSGRRVYYGWPYFAWSAGYDTRKREEVVKDIYGGTDPEKIRALLNKEHLRFIVIDNGNREQQLYKLQEGLLRQLFPVVFSHDDLIVLEVKPKPAAL